MNHLPVLQVIVPLLAAPSCAVMRRGAGARIFASLIAVSAFAMALALLQQVTSQGPIRYALGGWPPPWGIEYRVDVTTAFVLVAVTGIAAVVIPAGPGARSHQLAPGREGLFYAATLLCLTGLLGMVVTADAFNVFVFLEISSLSTYTLVSLGSSRRALRAAFVYLVIGTIGGTFVLLAIGLMYQVTGTLNMADLAVRLAASDRPRTVLVAFAFLMVGLSIKLAVFPLHQWLIGAYAYAPSSVSAFISGTSTKVTYYLLLRFIFGVFGASLVFGTLRFGSILLPLSLAAMFIGSFAALYQRDLKRMLAYSSVAQLGYMTLGLSLNNLLGLKAGLLHLLGHGLMKSGLFMVCGCLTAALGSTRLNDIRGLGRRMPLTAGAFVVGGLGMIGVPGTVGFVSKWYLIAAALSAGQPAIAVLILLSSLVAVAYVWRVVELCYLQPPSAAVTAARSSGGLLAPALILLGGSVYFGLATQYPSQVATQAAEALMGGLAQ